LWTDEDFADGWLDNQDLFDKAEQYAPGHAVGQFRSDVARYEILYRFGGVYADCDVEPLKPFDDLLGVEAFAGWESEGTFVGNTIIGGVPGARFWGEMVRAVAGSARSKEAWITPFEVGCLICRHPKDS
jgi:mannosyltransferase OCH1-like enzyme